MHRNRQVITSELMAIVMVGALFVGNLEAVFPIPPAGPGLRIMDYDRPGQTPVWLGKGVELGRFNMGSTVIPLFGPGGVSFASGLLPQRTLRMGEPIGTWSPGRHRLTRRGSGGLRSAQLRYRRMFS